MMKWTLLPIAMAAATPVLAQTPPPPPPQQAKTESNAYVLAAGQSDTFEINSSQVALQKSQDPAIRKYAQMLINHHQKTTAATVRAAAKAGVTPPPPALAPGAEASIAELQTASPADFDRLYIAQQIPAHQAALALHQGYSTSGDKTPLRASAKSAVPIVRQHLNSAMKLQNGAAGGHSGSHSGS